MAWERSFEKKVLKIRDKELYFQRRNYIIEVNNKFFHWVRDIITFVPRHFSISSGNDSVRDLSFRANTQNVHRNASPIVVTLVSFWHFAVIRQQTLTPSIAFTSVCAFLKSFSQVFYQNNRCIDCWYVWLHFELAAPILP